MFSIDQNCHTLWDVVWKLQALLRRGHDVTHFVEDIDVAFTALGASPGEPLRLAPERTYRSGGSDWGAAMFYFRFLGRQPVEIRRWEPLTGMATKVLARRLDTDIDALYDRYAVSDNWQLIGPSYVQDREHHRVLGDLSVAETRDFLHELMTLAQRDCEERFPEQSSRERTAAWFDRERGLLDELLDENDNASLADLYEAWLRRRVEGATIRRTSQWFALDAPHGPQGGPLLEAFCREYDLLAKRYNAACDEADVGLRPLDVDSGELPFFATTRYEGHTVRTACRLADGRLHVGEVALPLKDGRLPLDALRKAGVQCLAGKALLLVIQARYGEGGDELALPHFGSLYMPAAHRLAEKLSCAGVLDGELRPVMRVHFDLLDHLRELDTVIRLPGWLAGSFDDGEIPARALGERWRDLRQEAIDRLERFRDKDGRKQWFADALPELSEEIEGLKARRRQLAQENPKGEAIRELGRRQKELERRQIEALIECIDVDWQLASLDHWDARGAIGPWAVALGGRDFQERLLDNARYEPETHRDAMQT